MDVELEKNNKSNENIINNENKKINNDIDYEVTVEKQNNFLDSTLGKTINTALNVGLRYLLPDVIEDQVIEIKDTIITDGFKEGINKTIESAVDLGKSALGIVTGKFDNISQIQKAVEKGGLLDTISDGIDLGLNEAKRRGILPSNLENVIKNGKNVLISNIESNIEDTLTNQLKGVEKLNRYINNWNTYYKQQNFSKMELEYNKIKEKLEELVPLEDTLKKAHQVENLHTLIKNRGQDFNLSEEEIALANKLI